jgi:hypothetical protein
MARSIVEYFVASRIYRKWVVSLLVPVVTVFGAVMCLKEFGYYELIHHRN